MFRGFFSRKNAPLTGAPAVRRLKTYSSQSGYVYQYYYEGSRPYATASERGTEFVFNVTADRKSWRASGVFVSDHAVCAWEETHARPLVSAERYAIAKMALFQAFDERSAPAQMQEAVRVRNADVEAILETLGLE